MALAAMTKDSDNSGEHENANRVNFQSGMGDNYERLEFIGDTFLKTVTTISTVIQNPNDDEFASHCTRMGMLCNANLFNVAVEMQLYEYIRSVAFSKRMWYPEGLTLLDGKGMNKNEETSVVKHVLGQKTIADVCEALIGAAYTGHDRPGEKWHPSHWEQGVRAVTKLVK
ncbi:Dicer-like protein 1, partial [Teratosphaeriaceae sp. CCFEE 6253]